MGSGGLQYKSADVEALRTIFFRDALGGPLTEIDYNEVRDLSCISR